MLSFAVLLASFAAGAYGQFVEAPLGFTTTKGYAGYNVRWKEVPTGPDGICELVCILFIIVLKRASSYPINFLTM